MELVLKFVMITWCSLVKLTKAAWKLGKLPFFWTHSRSDLLFCKVSSKTTNLDVRVKLKSTFHWEPLLFSKMSWVLEIQWNAFGVGDMILVSYFVVYSEDLSQLCMHFLSLSNIWGTNQTTQSNCIVHTGQLNSTPLPSKRSVLWSADPLEEISAASEKLTR